MQKIFTRYLCFVIAVALLAVLILNYVLQSRNAQLHMLENSKIKLEQIAQTVHSNNIELKNLISSLNEDYLTRARAFAYILEQNPNVLNSAEELERIKTLLIVDELHVINENGILYAGSNPKYIGMDFRSTQQTAEFMQILDNDLPYLIQDVQPNGAEQKIFQYIGVARKDQPGIVQVGIAPKRLLEAKKRNELPYILSRVPVDEGAKLYAVDQKSGIILANSDESLIGKSMSELGFQEDYATTYAKGGFYKDKKDRFYCVFKKYDDLILGITQDTDVLYANRTEQMFLILSYLLITFLILIFAIHHLLQRHIVDGIHQIMNHLTNITNGDLKTVVNVQNNPEFKQLSYEINQMVQSIVNATGKVSKIIEIAQIPIGVFECGNERKQVIATERLTQIMQWSEEEAASLYKTKEHFMEKLQEIMSHREADEEDIYKISDIPKRWIQIRMITDNFDTFGVVIDVTETMLEKRKIKHERDYDALTGLCNLSKFKKAVNLELNSVPIEAALVMLDLDYFKGINDEYGHDFGDSYLRQTAYFLKQFNNEQGIAARRSGDEFCIFLHHYQTKEEILELFDSFYKQLAAQKILFPDGTKKAIQISAGLIWYGGQYTDFQELIGAADYALYDAKKNGRNVLKIFRQIE